MKKEAGLKPVAEAYQSSAGEANPAFTQREAPGPGTSDAANLLDDQLAAFVAAYPGDTMMSGGLGSADILASEVA
ncbi:hypothetical protein MMC08_007551 [Hypocenomyce scalaris]|nr:hypothetical protein [Hypocenomyce scalaris]